MPAGGSLAFATGALRGSAVSPRVGDCVSLEVNTNRAPRGRLWGEPTEGLAPPSGGGCVLACSRGRRIPHDVLTREFNGSSVSSYCLPSGALALR